MRAWPRVWRTWRSSQSTWNFCANSARNSSRKTRFSEPSTGSCPRTCRHQLILDLIIAGSNNSGNNNINTQTNRQYIKPCSHATPTFAWNVMNGIYCNKWGCSLNACSHDAIEVFLSYIMGCMEFSAIVHVGQLRQWHKTLYRQLYVMIKSQSQSHRVNSA